MAIHSPYIHLHIVYFEILSNNDKNLFGKPKEFSPKEHNIFLDKTEDFCS